jgi:hypothetical protein
MSIDPNEGTYHREWSEDELRDLIKDVNEELLDNYYWEYVAPLEKQLKELGHKTKKNKPAYSTVSYRPNRTHELYIGGYGNNKWELFFTNLMFELWNAGFLIRPENSDFKLKEKMNPNTMNFTRCFDGIIGLLESMEQPTWQNNKKGDLELCVYMIDELIRLEIIKQFKKDVLTEKIFGIKDPTRKRNKWNYNEKTFWKPKRHKEIDSILSTCLNKEYK